MQTDIITCRKCARRITIRVECCVYCGHHMGPMEKKCKACGEKKQTVKRNVKPHASTRYHEGCKEEARREQKLACWHRNKESYR